MSGSYYRPLACSMMPCAAKIKLDHARFMHTVRSANRSIDTYHGMCNVQCANVTVHFAGVAEAT